MSVTSSALGLPALLRSDRSVGVQFIDASDYHPTKSVTLGEDSDNVRYDPVAKRLFVGFGGGALAVINPADGKVLGEAKLSGHPESFQLERSGSRMFVNVPDANQIAVVDRAATKVIATWPVVGAKANFPMALDEPNHRVFVGWTPARQSPGVRHRHR